MTTEEISKEFAWARSLTLDLLRSSTDRDLLFQVGADFGPLWKQFRHVGRVHENYLNALQTGKIQFGFQGCTYTEHSSKDGLLSYFASIQARHEIEVARDRTDISIDWFGEPTNIELHLTRLLSHETLHHGQLILYWRALSRTFPKSWNSWGE